MLGKVLIGLLVAAGLVLAYMLLVGSASAGEKDSKGGWNYGNTDKEFLDKYAVAADYYRTPEQGAARGAARSAASASAAARHRR